MYDVIIIGAGAAGLSAGLYASRSLLSTLVIEKEVMGGLITTTSEIENYPGSIEGETGISLTQRMHKQAAKYGTEFSFDEISKIEKENNIFKLYGFNDKIYETRSVVIATGSKPRLLGIDGEQKFRGRGVSYCATCDAGFFRDKHVAVIGGGDTAVKEANYLTKFCSKVTLIHRRDEFRASKAVLNEAKNNDKLEYLMETIPNAIEGEMKVTHLSLKSKGEDIVLDVDGVFIFAGYTPNTSFVDNLLELDKDGYIIANEKMETSMPGVYVAGDVRNTVLRQVITASADGAIAATCLEEYLNELK